MREILVGTSRTQPCAMGARSKFRKTPSNKQIMSNSQQNNTVPAVQCRAIVSRPTFDADGYPTEETKFAIKAWDFRDAPGWLTYIRDAWNHRYGRMWEEGGLLKLATGGWSGNEAIIHAMRENYALWLLLWESSHRGGLEVLKMPNSDPDAKMNTVTIHSTAEIKYGLCMSREGWVKAADYEAAMSPALAADALLADVVRYRRGLGRYDFSRLSDDERGIATLEAWEELETRINTHLHTVGIKVS